MAEQRRLPEWALAIGNSRLLVSASGEGFLVDAGYKGARPKLDELAAQGRLKGVEGKSWPTMSGARSISLRDSKISWRSPRITGCPA